MDILQVRNITKIYEKPVKNLFLPASRVKALDEVSFDLKEGKALGLVGESGCGKSTLAKIITKLLNPTSGDVFFESKNITGLSERDFRPFRNQMQNVCQNSYNSLCPYIKIKNIDPIMQLLILKIIQSK